MKPHNPFFPSLVPWMCFVLALFSFTGVSAQVSNGFEGLTTAQNCDNVSCEYIDVFPNGNVVAHALADGVVAPPVNGLTIIPVNQTGSGSLLGFSSFFTPTRSSTVPGLTDGDSFGVAGNTKISDEFGLNAPQGSQAFIFEDTDGLASLIFDRVDLTGTTSPSVNFKYKVAGTSYESEDVARVKLIVDQCSAAGTINIVELVGQSGVSNDPLEAAGALTSFTTETFSLSPYIGCRVQLIAEFDGNSSSERFAIDDVNFTQGILDGGGPVCVDPDVPTLPRHQVRFARVYRISSILLDP